MKDDQLVTNAIVDALTGGPIAGSDLSPDGISRVTLLVGEAGVEVSWYSGADPCVGSVRQVLVNGEGLPVSSRQIAAIVHAAQARAKHLRDAKLAFLAGRRPRP